MKFKKLCPECNNADFEQDSIHAQTICRKCGLVIVGPPYSDTTYQGFKKIILREDATCTGDEFSILP